MITNSRYGGKREWKIYDNHIKLICNDVLFVSCHGNSKNIDAIDPDGGPFVSVNSSIIIDKTEYLLEKINDYTLEDNVLTVYISYKKIEK